MITNSLKIISFRCNYRDILIVFNVFNVELIEKYFIHIYIIYNAVFFQYNSCNSLNIN